MKLPFDFGIKLIFRLVLPGFILSLGFAPLLRIVLQLQGWSEKWEYAFVAMVILLGWAIIIADMPIYILMEGRRFWPKFIKNFAMDRLKNRLERLTTETNSTDDHTAREAWFKLRGNFQMSNGGDYEVVLPSRLGNVIYAYEKYSLRTYGLDAIFYWPRIWLKLDKDTREEIDSNQALVDSTVYAAFALSMCAFLWILYAVLKFLIVFIQASFTLTPRLQYDLTLIDQRLPRKGLAVLVAAIFLVAGYLIYRMSLFLYAQFGEYFKSVFDVNASAIDISPVMEEVVRLSAQSSCPVDIQKLNKKEQFPIAARYLQYYRYRCPACNALLKPDQIKTHVCPPKNETTKEDLPPQQIAPNALGSGQGPSPTTVAPEATAETEQESTTVAPAGTPEAEQPPTTAAATDTPEPEQPPTTAAPTGTPEAEQPPTTTAATDTPEPKQPPTTAAPTGTPEPEQPPTTAAPELQPKTT